MSGREKVRRGMGVGVKRWDRVERVEERKRMCVAPESVMRGDEREVRREGGGKNLCRVLRVGRNGKQNFGEGVGGATKGSGKTGRT